MNDLETLRAALTIEPDQEAADRSRRRLQNRINGGALRRKRTGWLAVGTVAVAAAAAAIMVLPSAPVESSGADILLAAATAAEQAPATSGTYWHVTLDPKGETAVWDYWVTPDGQWWYRTPTSPVTLVGSPANPFWAGSVHVTLDQLRSMPTEPAALRAWLDDALIRSDIQSHKGPLTASDRDQHMYWCLTALVSTVPAPPEVRAAAFRALAASPGVVNLGAVPGGQGLSLPGNNRIVVDPTTGRVSETSVHVNVNGTFQASGDPGDTYGITTEWTNTLP